MLAPCLSNNLNAEARFEVSPDEPKNKFVPSADDIEKLPLSSRLAVIFPPDTSLILFMTSFRVSSLSISIEYSLPSKNIEKVPSFACPLARFTNLVFSNASLDVAPSELTLFAVVAVAICSINNSILAAETPPDEVAVAYESLEEVIVVFVHISEDVLYIAFVNV